jgi:hypothetical protein
MAGYRLRQDAVRRPTSGWVGVDRVLMDSDEWIEFGKLFGAGEPSVKNGIENFSGRPRKSPVHERGVGDATVIAGLYPAAAWIGAVTSGAGAYAR